MKTALTIDSSRPAVAPAAAWTASIETTILNRLSLKAPEELRPEERLEAAVVRSVSR